MSLFRTLLMEKQGGGILPAGYTQLNYIKSYGLQGIETNWAPADDNDHFRHEATMSQHTYTDYTTLFGNYAYGSRMGGFWSTYGVNPVTIGDGEYLDNHTLGQGVEVWKLEVDGSNNYIKADFNGIVETGNYSGSISNQYGMKLMIFCGMQYGEASYFALHDFKTYEIDNGVETLVRHYIPALRNSDNIPGLYEVCENIFYTNTAPYGDGTFLYG